MTAPEKYKVFAIGSLRSIMMVAIFTNLEFTPLWLVMILNVIFFAAITGHENDRPAAQDTFWLRKETKTKEPIFCFIGLTLFDKPATNQVRYQS